MTKLTIISYAHKAHKEWIPFWAEQLKNQEFQDFNVVFVCHNWGEESEQKTAENMLEVGAAIDGLVDDNFLSRLKIYSYWSRPVIGEVIDFAASKVETEWLAHMDLDDIIHPSRLKIQMEFLENNPDVDFLNARCNGFYGETPSWPDDLYQPIDDLSPMIKWLKSPNLQTHNQIKECLDKGYNCLAHGLMIYRPEVLQTIGGFSKSDVKTDGLSPDQMTWIKAIAAGYNFYRLPELLMMWRLDSSSIRK